jgi:hypothetical protein
MNVEPMQWKSYISIYRQISPSTLLCILRWNLVLRLQFSGMQRRVVWYIPQDRSTGIHCHENVRSRKADIGCLL